MSSPTPGFRSKPDPTKDKAARYVLRAHKNAVAAGKASPECYLAGVEAWRRGPIPNTRLPMRPHPGHRGDHSRHHELAARRLKPSSHLSPR